MWIHRWRRTKKPRYKCGETDWSHMLEKKKEDLGPNENCDWKSIEEVVKTLRRVWDGPNINDCRESEKGSHGCYRFCGESSLCVDGDNSRVAHREELMTCWSRVLDIEEGRKRLDIRNFTYGKCLLSENKTLLVSVLPQEPTTTVGIRRRCTTSH